MQSNVLPLRAHVDHEAVTDNFAFLYASNTLATSLLVKPPFGGEVYRFTLQLVKPFSLVVF